MQPYFQESRIKGNRQCGGTAMFSDQGKSSPFGLTQKPARTISKVSSGKNVHRFHDPVLSHFYTNKSSHKLTRLSTPERLRFHEMHYLADRPEHEAVRVRLRQQIMAAQQG